MDLKVKFLLALRNSSVSIMSELSSYKFITRKYELKLNLEIKYHTFK